MDTTAKPSVSCIANYAYDASEVDELTIRPGNLIRDVQTLPGGWWCGEHHGIRGMFPDNFVTVLNDEKNPSRPVVQGLCRAVFCYQPANPDELPLCVGDELEVLGEVEEGWWQGMRQGSVGVFPSNFVVMLDPPAAAGHAPPAEPAPALPFESVPALPYEPAPALPPKPSREQYRVLFPYGAMNDDELTLAEGDVVTIVSKDAPDRGWWRGELHGRVGLFPDNFVQLIPSSAQEGEEKRLERPSAKTSNPIYPVLNKYTEKTHSAKELTTSKSSLYSEFTTSNDSITQSTITLTSKSESGKLTHSDTVSEGTLETQLKKPPVPVKKSPTPASAVSSLFSGLKNKMKPSTDKEKSSTTVPSGSSNGGEWDKTDGGAPSKPATSSNSTSNSTTTITNTTSITNTTTITNTTAAVTTNTTANKNNATSNSNTFDHVERNSILNDPRAGRVKAPRRRPPSQVLRDDTPQQIGLSNGHEVGADKAASEKEAKPRAREWQKHRAPWMDELKLNQARKTRAHDAPAAAASTDRILDWSSEADNQSTHSMEMSKSTSSISNRISVIESLESTLEQGKVRHSVELRKEASPSEPTALAAPVHSPTAAGRTLTAMLDEVKKPPAPAPPTSLRTDNSDKSRNSKDKTDKITTSEKTVHESISVSRMSGSVIEKSSTMERTERVEEKVPERPASVLSGERFSTLERRLPSQKDTQKIDGTDALIAQLNYRITNLEKLIEVQNVKFNASIDELNLKLSAEMKKRIALQTEMEKLAQCVTQV